jgi:hypothetical protein
MERVPVVQGASQVLAHTPGLARHGSKPRRELAKDPGLEPTFLRSLRSFSDAVAYPPHQAYLGTLHPRELPARPWVGRSDAEASRFGPAGELVPEEEFFGLLAAVDEFGLVTLAPEVAGKAAAALAGHRLAKRLDLARVEAASGDVEASRPGALPLHLANGSAKDRPAGAIQAARDDDEALAAPVLLENLAAKATAALALLHLLDRHGIDPQSVDYVIGCGEEAVGDRYQRGGGNLAKAVAATAGLTEASGADVKNFCAVPVPALVLASSLVVAGVFDRVVVVAGGSLPKLGMKFQGHLRQGLPVLEDVIGGAAALVGLDDGVSPRLRLDGVGRHRVAAGGSTPRIMEALAVEPLDRLGLSMTAVDDYATELHNPEITQTAGSGNVPERNYRTIAALASRRGDIDSGDIDDFVMTHGMPGFAPTQGHLASAFCYLPHAVHRLVTGDASRVILLAKGSLFLGQMCQLSDGMSVLLERNPGRGARAALDGGGESGQEG